MATVEKDAISGQYTTGHEWDGIKELNTPLPKWWVYVFYATIAWAIFEWVVLPTWPTPGDFTKGIWNYSSRAELADEMKAVAASRSSWTEKFKAVSVEDANKNAELRNYAIAAGKTTFAENCAPCHGSGGAGTNGYPTLADDEWIWGGSLDEIQTTIAYGVRNTNANSRQSIMTAFGADGILNKDQINQVAEYVLSLSKASTDANAAAAGKTIFAENCVACHGEDAKGVAALGAPALDNGIWLFKATNQKEAVVAQITKPKHGEMPAWSERLDETTIKQLAIYVHSLGGGK